MRVFLTAFFAFAILHASQAQEEPDHATTGKYAVALGIGNRYGGLGGYVEYQYLLKERIRLTPYIAVGAEIVNAIFSRPRLGYCAGAGFEWGSRNRLFIGPDFGTHGIAYSTAWADAAQTIIDHYYDQHVLIGPSLNAGYKYTSAYGLIWQFSSGVTYILNGRNDQHAHNRYWQPVLAIGLGYKI